MAFHVLLPLCHKYTSCSLIIENVEAQTTPCELSNVSQLLQNTMICSSFVLVATFPGGRIVGNKVFVTSGYEGTFDDLKQRCLQAGGQLAVPRNAEENTAIQQIVVLHKKSVFLGVFQTEGKFKYLNGDAIVYSNWQSGEPNNDKGNENCVEVYVTGKWNDRSCGEKRLILCEF